MIITSIYVSSPYLGTNNPTFLFINIIKVATKVSRAWVKVTLYSFYLQNHIYLCNLQEAAALRLVPYLQNCSWFTEIPWRYKIGRLFTLYIKYLYHRAEIASEREHSLHVMWRKDEETRPLTLHALFITRLLLNTIKLNTGQFAETNLNNIPFH